MANKENENVVEHKEVVEHCARRDRDDIFEEESDVSSIEAEEDVFVRRIHANLLSKIKCFITLYNYIYIYYTYNYVSYTYFTVYVEVFVCFEIALLTSGVSFFVRCACYVVYEDTNVYKLSCNSTGRAWR